MGEPCRTQRARKLRNQQRDRRERMAGEYRQQCVYKWYGYHQRFDTQPGSEGTGLEPNPDWDLLSRNIPILKFPDGVTKENATYDGVDIKQADVNLLAYPLEIITGPGTDRKGSQILPAENVATRAGNGTFGAVDLAFKTW